MKCHKTSQSTKTGCEFELGITSFVSYFDDETIVFNGQIKILQLSKTLKFSYESETTFYDENFDTKFTYQENNLNII